MKRTIVCLLFAGLLCIPAAAAASGSPTIGNAAPTAIRNHEATIRFSIDPEGLETTYYAEYGLTTSYGDRSWLYEWDLPAGDDPVALSEPLSVWGLAAGTTYHYRIVAYNDEGTTYGTDQELTTTNEPKPTVVTEAATDDTFSSVVLHGTVDPEGLPLSVCHFRYVTDSQFNRFGFSYSIGPVPTLMGNVVPCEETPAEIGSGNEPVPVHAVLESYPGGRRHFRLEAENAYDVSASTGSETFGAPTPVIEYLAPSPRNHEATVHFTIDPQGLETEYEVEYGSAEGEYHEFNEPWSGTLPAGDDPVERQATFPAFFEGPLSAGKTFHWRVVAKSAAGTTVGPDETFTTTDEPAALVTTSPVSEATTENVHFEGTVDPEGNPLTGCRFRWVTPSTYQFAGFEKWGATQVMRFGETVPCAESMEEIGDGTEPVSVHADVGGMEQGTYFVRLEVENAYEDTAPETGLEFRVTVPSEAGEVGKGCEHDPGCGPPATKPPVVTPPVGSPHPKAKKKPRKKKRRQRVQHNTPLIARR
ncbi:MAG TPA: hypothetical protein VFU11_08940 [Solirubrobacterales bacterium]|nr:hypothetical protein [Solirubrobacterales bacterium]